MSDCWTPAEHRIPSLLADIMHMDTVHYSGHVIEQYKHCDTRRYLNLDHDGDRAWEIAVDAGSGALAARQVDFAAALAYFEGAAD